MLGVTKYCMEAAGAYSGLFAVQVTLTSSRLTPPSRQVFTGRAAWSTA